MAAITPRLVDGFSPENIERIYHGLPALTDGSEPESVLTEEQFEAASYYADGLSYKEITEITDKSVSTVRTRLHLAYDRLRVIGRFQLAGFFPLETDNIAVEDKKLADISQYATSLSILESLSTGMPYQHVADTKNIPVSTARTHMHSIGKVWPDLGGTMMNLRVANAIRAGYVEALEARPGTIQNGHLRMLTLPVLARIEPRIRAEFLENAEVANPTAPAA